MRLVTASLSFSIGSTGGTTGDPIEIWHSRKSLAIVEAAIWRSRSWIGIKPWTKCVSFRAFGRGSWYGRLRLLLTQKWLMDIFGKTSSEKESCALELIRIAPEYIEGYVSDTLALGDACFNNGVQIKAVLTTGEMLYQHQRKEIEERYGAKVFDNYGCNEIGALAFECEMGNKHITDEHVIMEVVDDQGVPVWDEPGRIIITDLDNHLTPFIRYEVGDIGILTRSICSCGRKLTVLKKLEGRTQDFIVNEAGVKLSTLYIAARFKDLKLIHRLQIVQRSLNDIVLLYEGSSDDIEKELHDIMHDIKTHLGQKTRVTSLKVEHLIYTQRGKFELIISLDKSKHLNTK